MTSQTRDGQVSSNSASGRGQRRPRFRRLRDVLGDEVRRHHALVAAGLGVMALVGAMAYFTSRREMLPLDLRTTVRLQSVRFRPFADLMYAVSIPGYYPWNVLTVAAGSLLIGRWLNWRDGAYVAGLTIAQGLTNHTIKTTVGRPRPADSVVEVIFPHTGLSFPSGHVMFYTAFFGFAFFLALTRLHRSPGRKLVLATSGALVLLVGPSRIYLGAHWLSDVVAGHMLSFVILLLGVELYVRYVQERQSPNGSNPRDTPPSGADSPISERNLTMDQSNLGGYGTDSDNPSRMQYLRRRLRDEPRYQVAVILTALTLPALILLLPINPQAEYPDDGLLHGLMQLISLPGLMPWNAALVVLLAAYVGWWLGWRSGGFLAAITLGQGLLTTLLKIAFPVDRPMDVDVNAPFAAINNAFPSGHVMFYVVFFGFLFYLVRVRLGRSAWKWLPLTVLGVLIMLGGASRMYLGTHWLIDVAGAQVIGLAFLIVSIEVYERYVLPPRSDDKLGRSTKQQLVDMG